MAAETGGHQIKQSYFGFTAEEWHILSDEEKMNIRLQTVAANQHGIKPPATGTDYSLNLKQLDEPLSSSIHNNKNNNKNKNKNKNKKSKSQSQQRSPIVFRPKRVFVKNRLFFQNESGQDH